MFNILSLDGGGVYGIHTAIILKRLNDACPGFVGKSNFFAGTSVGGLIALALADNEVIEDVITMCQNASAFFTASEERKLIADAGQCAHYNNVGKQAYLTKIFGNKTLGQLPNHVMVQSFQLDSTPVWSSKVFHNIPGGDKITDTCNALAVDAGMATSAAPTYFPVYNTFIDGAVVANDPAMTALSLTQDSSLQWGSAIALQDVNLFSVGRIYAGDDVDRHNWDAGWANWISLLLNLLLDGNQGVVDYQVRQFLGNKYYRHAGDVPKAINCSIDDVSEIPKIQAWAENLDLTKEIAWIQANW